jgi:hypothetical protein
MTTIEQLYEKITGTPNPLQVNEREKAIFKKCLSIINDLEKDLEEVRTMSNQSKLIKECLESFILLDVPDANPDADATRRTFLKQCPEFHRYIFRARNILNAFETPSNV